MTSQKKKHITDSKETIIVLFLFFASGAVGLVYEVLWLKELNILFGNTSYAAATTLSVFFLGLSMGGYVWGKQTARISNLVRAYGLLEMGIGFTALLYFLLLNVYFTIYEPLFDFFGGNPAIFLSVKFLLSLTLLFPPAFVMGGTLPVLGEHFIRRPNELGKTGTSLYALNTSGAVFGALIAGFFLPPLLGYTHSYLAAIASSILIGLLALLLGSNRDQSSGKIVVPRKSAKPALINFSFPVQRLSLYILAFASGFLALGLQVSWTRMFCQVLDNTVYTFSLILIVFLVALAIGSGIANVLCRKDLEPLYTLCGLLILSGLACSITPTAFIHITKGLTYPSIAESGKWSTYIFTVFGFIVAIIMIPSILLGSIFPYLLKAAEVIELNPGGIIGRLISINTLGAIIGSLTTGFAFLNWLGLWTTIKILCFIYPGLALILTFKTSYKTNRRVFLGISGSIILFLIIILPIRYPLAHIESEKSELVEVIEGSNAIVSVIKYKDKNDVYMRIFLNNTYSPGGNKPSSVATQWRQTDLPLSLHPAPQSIFYLGMGTGITAGRALRYNVKKVTVCELVPEIVTASRKYFSEYVSGLYNDPRAKVIIEDGRNYLQGKREKFDVIIADLFLPWKSGIGNLYTIEHFQTVQSRLNADGLFVQWLPFYQLSSREFNIIAKTFLEVFKEATLWRNSFSPNRPLMAIVGHNNRQPLKKDTIIKNFDQMNTGTQNISEAIKIFNMLVLYTGRITQDQKRFQGIPVNTDDRPIIEFFSPRSFQNRMAKRENALTNEELYILNKELFSTIPPETDSFLKNFNNEYLKYAQAGLNLYACRVYQSKEPQKSKLFLSRFLEKVPEELKSLYRTPDNKK